MRDILLTSSALILALLAIRRLFRRTLSRRVQYALWGLVLLRLLVPISPAADFSLLTAAEPVVGDIGALYVAPYRDTVTVPEGTEGPHPYGQAPYAALGPATQDNTYVYSNHFGAVHKTQYERQISLEALLRPVWRGGMAVMACWMALSNLRFWRKLRKARRPYPVEGFRRPVYLVEEGLPSPCLFGLLRPAVYLTPAALASPESLRHVLAHEETHARHLDPLWSLLRGVCLVIYWFDPLVWWAALASRTDCELACDEGALRRLGEAERVPYGRTLLSLVGVRRLPADPLLSATTMTADKRRLMDRITRIAENRKSLGTALFAVIALAALVCAVTFTGAKTPESEPPRFASVEEALAALPEELNASDDAINGLTFFTPEERSPYFDLKDGEIFRVHWSLYVSASSNLSNPLGWLCSLYRLERDASPGTASLEYLLEYYGDGTGDSDEVQEVVGMDERYVYALIHPLSAPELKQGQTTGAVLMDRVIRQIREAVLSSAGVTPVSASVRPDWEPIAVIPLDGLEPYEPEIAEEIPVPYDYWEMLDIPEDPDRVLGDYGLSFFKAGPTVYAGVQRLVLSSFPAPFWSFSPSDDGSYSVSFFRNLMGHDGFCITSVRLNPYERQNDYYYLDGDGQPVHLARVKGFPELIDLDGDGQKELVSQAFYAGDLYFLRDGKHYRADLNTVLGDYWPDYGSFYYDNWGAASRSLPFRADKRYHDPSPAGDSDYRALYFDGENLLVYNDQRHFDGHVLDWPDEPYTVIDTARNIVEEAYHAARTQGEDCDDWRILHLGRADTFEVNGQEYLVYYVSFEFHSPQPRQAPELGGRDAQDCWTDPFYPQVTYLAFQVDSQEHAFGADTIFLGSFRRDGGLSGKQFQEWLDSLPPLSKDVFTAKELLDGFQADPVGFLNGLGGEEQLPLLASALADQRVLRSTWYSNAQYSILPSAAGNGTLNAKGFSAWTRLNELVNDIMSLTAAEQVRAALDEIMSGNRAALTLTAPAGGGRYAAKPEDGPDDYFTSGYDWRWAGTDGTYVRSPVSLLAASEDGGTSLCFWPGSSLVLLNQDGEETWFSAVSNEPSDEVFRMDIFDYMRLWYDQAEWAGLLGDVVIPDRGQSRLAVAQEWVDRRISAAAKATSGSMYAHSYGRAVVELEEHVPETAFPEWTEGMERFCFSYEEIFVPENDKPTTHSSNRAGNTVEYDGQDGYAPEGALARWQVGYLYLAGDGWRCDSVGTGF